MIGYGISRLGGLWTALTLLLAGPAAGAGYEGLAGALDTAAAEAVKKTDVAGLSIAVVDAEGVVWRKSYGAASSETLYRAAGLSGPVTAMEIMRRVDRGELRLDDPLTAHLPGFAVHSRFPQSRPITIRALLAHHSGLPSQIMRGSAAVSMSAAEADAALAALQEQIRNENLAEAPQSHFKVSGLGYGLLGRMIEVRSGRSFAGAMEEELLQPLGMTRSTFAPASAVMALAAPHRAGKRLAAVERRDRPASSLITALDDAAQFVRFILNDGRTASGQTLVKPGVMKAMFEPQFAGQPLDFGQSYGLGWSFDAVKASGAGRVAASGAGFDGYTSLIAVAREHRLGVVILSNDDAAGQAAQQLARKALELAVAARQGRPAPGEDAVSAPAPYQAANLGEYAGDYIVFGEIVHVEARTDRLRGKAMGTQVELIPTGRDRFSPQLALLGAADVFGLFKYSLPTYSVRVVTAGGRRFAVLEGMGQPQAFERVERRPIPASWRARLGAYRCDNPDGVFEMDEAVLSEADGVLTLSAQVSSKLLEIKKDKHVLALAPLSDGEAVAMGAGPGQGGTVRAAEREGRPVLIYSGFSFTRQP